MLLYWQVEEHEKDVVAKLTRRSCAGRAQDIDVEEKGVPRPRRLSYPQAAAKVPEWATRKALLKCGDIIAAPTFLDCARAPLPIPSVPSLSLQTALACGETIVQSSPRQLF